MGELCGSWRRAAASKQISRSPRHSNCFTTLKGGDDVAELDGGAAAALVVRNSLDVDMGSGADQLLMNNVHVLRLHVNMGTGSDLINIGSDGDDPGVMVTKEAIIVTG